MPENPTWEFIGEAARKMTDRSPTSTASACAARPAGARTWRSIGSMANSFGARWFDEELAAAVRPAPMEGGAAVLRRPDEGRRPPGRLATGFNENLTLFQQGKCGIWIDATVAGVVRSDSEESTVADKVAYTIFPNMPASTTTGTGSGRGTWLSRPARSTRRRQDLHHMGDPQGLYRTRRREGGLGGRAAGHPHPLYEHAEYLDVAAFADVTLGRDGRRRHHQADGAAGALYRWPVRGDPRVPGDRHHGRPALLGGARGPVHRSMTRSPRLSRPTEREIRRAGY